MSDTDFIGERSWKLKSMCILLGFCNTRFPARNSLAMSSCSCSRSYTCETQPLRREGSQVKELLLDDRFKLQHFEMRGITSARSSKLQKVKGNWQWGWQQDKNGRSLWGGWRNVKNKSSRNQAQDPWLKLPKLCHRATITKLQSAPWTITFSHLITSICSIVI